MSSLVLGYTRRNNQRLRDCIATLDKYLSPGWYVVGGICARVYLQAAGKPMPNRGFNGVDLVAETVAPAVSTESLIVHYHENGYWALVHIATGTKVNVFPPRHDRMVEMAELAPGFTVRIQSAADQLVSVLEDMGRLCLGQPVDPKQLEDVRRLRQIVAPEVSQATWSQRQHKEAFDATYENALLASKEQPQLLHPGLFTNWRHMMRQMLPCSDCDRRNRIYPLASRMRIARTFKR